LGERLVEDPQRGCEPCKYDTRGALNVVVVAEHLVCVALQHPYRIRSFPILEVNAATRKDLLNRAHELVSELVELIRGGWRFA
jgi:hypothetical protein